MTSLSHSTLNILQSCPKRYYYSKIENVERLGQTRGRRRGSAFSEALEHRDPSRVYTIYDKLIIDAVDQSYVDDLVCEREIVSILAKLHLDTFNDDEREIGFDLPIDAEGEYRNRGFIDAVTYGTDDESAYVILKEDKLMMMWSKADEAALPLNGQVLRYLDAASHIWPDKTCLGMEYRVTKYPGTYRKVSESASEYAARVCDQLRSKKTDELFVTMFIAYDDVAEQVAEYRKDLTTRLAEVSWRTANDAWPQAWGDACKAYGGCEFLPACKREPGFQSLYQTKEAQ